LKNVEGSYSDIIPFSSISRFESAPDFSQPMMNNSALMQSYNLMKMSSQVTKPQPMQYNTQDMRSDMYQRPPQMDYNKPVYPRQRSPNSAQMRDPNLAGISPAEMGIPHAPMGQPKPQESPGIHDSANRRSPHPPQNEFQSFEDTFKPMKKPEKNGPGNAPPQNDVPFDEIPVGGQKQQQPMQFEAPQIQNPKVEEQVNIDFNKAEAPIEPSGNPESVEDDRELPTNNMEAEISQPPANQDPNVLNVDEIQIKPKQQLTFEEMLEKELNDKENKGDALPKDDDRVIRKKPKKEFLKRTTKKYEVSKDNGAKRKYKYYADHFQKDSKKNTTASGSEVDKSDRSKSTSQSRVRGDKSKDDGNQNDMVHSTPKFSHNKNEDTPDEKGSSSSRNRRSRKARGPPNQSEPSLQKQSSLEEFEEIEKNLDTDKKNDYEVVKRTQASGHKASKSRTDSKPKSDMNKTTGGKNVNETGAERQRLAKEKQEFRKQKEKFENEKLTLEKQKRDLDKQKLEFEKNKDVEMKKLNAERQKIDKERKAMTRQNDKKKEDSHIVDKLYKEIDALKEEIRKKDNKVA
jgi:hypothetical protein